MKSAPPAASRSKCSSAVGAGANRRHRPSDRPVLRLQSLADTGRPGRVPGEKPNDIRYTFFGFETDAALASYLFSVIYRAIKTETTSFKLANPRLKAIKLRRASLSFQHGLVAQVAARLETMHAKREASVRRSAPLGPR